MPRPQALVYPVGCARLKPTTPGAWVQGPMYTGAERAHPGTTTRSHRNPLEPQILHLQNAVTIQAVIPHSKPLEPDVVWEFRRVPALERGLEQHPVPVLQGTKPTAWHHLVPQGLRRTASFLDGGAGSGFLGFLKGTDAGKHLSGMQWSERSDVSPGSLSGVGSPLAEDTMYPDTERAGASEQDKTQSTTCKENASKHFYVGGPRATTSDQATVLPSLRAQHTV